MTDGTSQGLFIVVAIVIFGIFTLLAYILFEDTLSPAMASMFNKATGTAIDRLDSRKILVGSWDMEVSAANDKFDNLENRYEFMQYGVDFAPIFDQYGTGKYVLEFDLKATNSGAVRVFMQNNNSYKYTWGFPNVEATETYQTYTLEVDVERSEYDTNRSELAFYGENYDTGRHPTVKNVRLYQIR